MIESGFSMLVREYPSKSCITLVVVHLLLLVVSTLYHCWRPRMKFTHKSAMILAATSTASVQILSLDLVLALASLCSDLAQLLRESLVTPLRRTRPFLQFHQLLYLCIIPSSALHAALSWITYGLGCADNSSSFIAYLYANLATISGFSGHVLILLLIVLLSRMRALLQPQKQPIPAFSVTIFLLIWIVHVSFTQSEVLHPTNSATTTWLCILCGLMIYSCQIAYREGRFTARHAMNVLEIIEHPGETIELRISKDRLSTETGQSIDICFPNLSISTYHSFDLMSAPEEDFLAVVVSCKQFHDRRAVRSLNNRFASLSSAFIASDVAKGSTANGVNLPQIFVRGPYGSPVQTIFKTDVALLVTNNANTARAASILKSIWFRANSPRNDSSLRKVYLYWVCEGFEEHEWFRSLLLAIEAQDIYQFIEIHICVSNMDESTHDLESADHPADSSLDWDTILESILDHQPSVGVFDLGHETSTPRKGHCHLPKERSEIIWHDCVR